MKSIFTLLLFVGLSLTSFGQVTPYVEFSEQNFTLVEAEKTVQSGDIIWYITDNNVPSDIKTYVFFQRPSTIANSPNPPGGWSAYKVTYDQQTKLKFEFSSPTKYIITEDQAVYIKIN